MKRKISFILSLLMVMAMMLQGNVFAAGDSGLQEAVKVVKSKITIPSNYTEFDYRNRSEGDSKIWTLNWNSKDVGGSISVSVDENGKILSYYNAIPDSYSGKKKLPKISKQDAKIKAEDFVKKMDTGLLDQVKYVESNQKSMTNVYDFNYIRLVEGIPFPENYIHIEVNTETGNVQSYNLTWTDGLTFPAKDKAISMEKAQSAYKDKLGLLLVYSSKTEDKKIKTYPVYSPKYSNAFIDALTGEKTDISSVGPYYGGYNESAYSIDGGSGKMMYGKAEAPADVQLSPDEIKAIEEASKLISKEDMEKKLRSLKVLVLTDEYTATNTYLEKNWSDPGNYTWNFNFTKNLKDQKIRSGSVNVSADAKSGEIKSFWISTENDGKEDVKYDKNASKTAVEEFLKEFQPDKFKETEYNENNSQREVLPLNNEEKPREYSFQYIRKVNGVPVPSNYISAGFDAVSGKITNYNLNWFDTTFQPVDKVIPLDKMYDTLFKELGLELQYKSNYPNVYEMKMGLGNNAKKPEIKLVYALKNDKPAIFDAFTGTILTSDGKPYKEVKAVEFKDIKGHFAEKQIKILAEFGITLEGDKFNPDKSILQKDFVKVLCGILNYYGGMSVEDSDENSQMDEMYKFLITEGVFKAGEKAPDSVVTREDSVKFIIRALKYDKVADLKGIYNCTFKDRQNISPNLVGYVVIANALNIIKGGNGCFYPKKALTRAEAMIEAYNYLQN